MVEWFGVGSMETLTSELIRVVAVRLPGWDPVEIHRIDDWVQYVIWLSGAFVFGTFLLYTSSVCYFAVGLHYSSSCFLFD